MNTQATERFLMKRDFAHDTSPGLETPSYLHSLAPETFDPDYERKAKEVWEAEQASAHTPLTGQDEDDIERMRKEFDEVFAF